MKFFVCLILGILSAPALAEDPNWVEYKKLNCIPLGEVITKKVKDNEYFVIASRRVWLDYSNTKWVAPGQTIALKTTLTKFTSAGEIDPPVHVKAVAEVETDLGNGFRGKIWALKEDVECTKLWDNLIKALTSETKK